MAYKCNMFKGLRREGSLSEKNLALILWYQQGWKFGNLHFLSKLRKFLYRKLRRTIISNVGIFSKKFQNVFITTSNLLSCKVLSLSCYINHFWYCVLFCLYKGKKGHIKPVFLHIFALGIAGFYLVIRKSLD